MMGASDRHGMATDFAHVRGDMPAQVHRPKIKANWRSRLTRLASVCLHIEFFTSTRHQTNILRGAPAGATGSSSFVFSTQADGADTVRQRQDRRLHASQVSVRGAAIRSQSHLHHTNRLPNRVKMADDFRIRLGRARNRGARADKRFRPFMKQVEAAVGRAGGNPARIGGSAGKGSGRFNPRGRGSKLSFPSDGGGWQRAQGCHQHRAPGTGRTTASPRCVASTSMPFTAAAAA
jgi:hypothetical protein